jgi:hypothetical protein
MGTDHWGQGGVANVDIDGNNTLEIKCIGVAISTFETPPAGGPTCRAKTEPTTPEKGYM